MPAPNSMKFKSLIAPRFTSRGFVMPLTLLVCSILLSVATSISIILVKELYFSKISRESQTAYYAADNGMMCAIMVDDKYVDPDTGIGIFQYRLSPTAEEVLTKINAAQGGSLMLTGSNSIKCATSEIFNPSSPNNFTVTGGYTSPNGDTGYSSTFTLRMDLDGTGSSYRCAKVTVNKTPSYRQIISQGYTTCQAGYVMPIERAVIHTSQR